MSSTAHTPDDIRERAALYTLGGLDAGEAHAFEGHLASGCTACNDEVSALRSVTDHLAYAAPAQRPRSQLRTRVLERVAEDSAQAGEPILEKQGVLFARSDRLPWHPGPGPGIEVKLLHHDSGRGFKTSLIRMEPGVNYPAHRHADVEEVYLLSGDLLVCGVVMHAGDYCRAEPGSVHAGISTHGGCLFISTYSEHNQRLT